MVQALKHEDRKAKAHLELNLVGTRRASTSMPAAKGRQEKTQGPLLNGAGTLVTQDMEKAEVLDAFFTSVFTGQTGRQGSQAPETRGRSGARMTYTWWRRTRSRST